MHYIVDYDLDERVYNKELHDTLFDIMKYKLTPREFAVLRARFFKGWTLKRTGEYFSLSKDRIRQIQEKALKKLRHPKLKPILKEFMYQDVT